jgi:hypothetical protein
MKKYQQNITFNEIAYTVYATIYGKSNYSLFVDFMNEYSIEADNLCNEFTGKYDHMLDFKEALKEIKANKILASIESNEV